MRLRVGSEGGRVGGMDRAMQQLAAPSRVWAPRMQPRFTTTAHLDHAGAVHVPLHVVPAVAAVGGQGALQVHRAARRAVEQVGAPDAAASQGGRGGGAVAGGEARGAASPATGRRHPLWAPAPTAGGRLRAGAHARLGRQAHGEARGVQGGHGEARAVDGDGRAHVRAHERRRRLDGEHPALARGAVPQPQRRAALQRAHGAHLLDDAAEHHAGVANGCPPGCVLRRRQTGDSETASHRKEPHAPLPTHGAAAAGSCTGVARRRCSRAPHR